MGSQSDSDLGVVSTFSASGKVSGAGWAEGPATDGAAEETPAEADAEVTGARGAEEAADDTS